MSLAEKILIGTLTLGIGGLGFIIIKSVEEGSKMNKFREVYNKAILKYGDLNFDQVISKEEMERFDLRILDGKNVFYTDGWPRYPNGEKVPPEIVTQWVEEYVKKQE
ncbi:hypothetical protein HZA97_00420 [Candidatus Woesearchaeota archaeon]|nr:hypothetical protein [Candidatus Woesearchaeota archaeon]